MDSYEKRYIVKDEKPAESETRVVEENYDTSRNCQSCLTVADGVLEVFVVILDMIACIAELGSR